MAVTSLLVRYSIGLKPPCTHTSPDDIETATTSATLPAAAAAAAAAEDVPAKGLADGTATPAGMGSQAVTAAATVELVAPSNGAPPIIVDTHQDSDLSMSTVTDPVAVTPHSSSISPKVPAAPAGDHLPSRDQPSSSNGGDSFHNSRRSTKLVSPFEVYCKLPLPGEESYNLATEPGVAPNGCPTHSDMIIARRSRSLVAAAAAVGGLVAQQHSTTPRGVAEGSVCVFR